jgi:cell wall assembly regulator SMI1
MRERLGKRGARHRNEVPFPPDEERVARAERELDRRLPPELRERLMRDNGGEIAAMALDARDQADFDPCWELHPVWDDSDRRRAARTASHIVGEAAWARAWPRFPDGAIPVASNGTGDRLIVLPDSDGFLHWNHADGSTSPVWIRWD